MAENSKIEWTHHTFNPHRGCTKVSAGCANCYAETLSGRNPKTLGIWGPNGTRVVASEAMWREPIRWDWFLDSRFYEGDEPLVQLGSHYDLVSKYPPESLADLAILLALVRPGKKELVGQDWEFIRS